MTTTKQEQSPEFVAISHDAWRMIDALLADLPYRVSAPIVKRIVETGGVRVVETPAPRKTDDT